MKSVGLTERQRLRNRKRYAAWQAKIEREIARFIKTAGVVPTRRRGNDCYEVAEYADAVVEGLMLRVETLKPEHLPEYCSEDGKRERLKPRLRWFYKRPGRRALALYVRDETPKAAREAARLMGAGDEDTNLCLYLENDGGGHCYYHTDSELLQELTFDQLKERIARKKHWLGCCEQDRACGPDFVWPLRREIQELEKTLKRYTDWMKREGLEIRIKAKPIVVEDPRSRRAA
jgi:hypothetical protein